MTAAEPPPPAPQPAFLHDPDVVVFATGRDIAVGAIHQQGISDVFGNLFGRSKELVRTEWEQALEQMRFFLNQASGLAGDYTLDEVQFQLGFSAQGQVVFVAQAGVTTTISVTFRRKESNNGGGPSDPSGGEGNI